MYILYTNGLYNGMKSLAITKYFLAKLRRDRSVLVLENINETVIFGL